MHFNFIGVLLLMVSIVVAQKNKVFNYQDQKPPAGRSQHAAAFDDETGTMLILGGVKHYKNTKSSSLTIDNQLWGWKNSMWKIISENGPSLRNDAKMVYHTINKKIYLYGGRSYDSTGKSIVYDEFWEWNSRSWKLLVSSNTPGKILHSNMVYDDGRNRIVLFGGVISGSGFLNTVWEWSGAAWQKIEAVNPPAPRIAHSMVYSPALKKVLIIGGVSQEGKKFQGDMVLGWKSF